MQSYDEVSSKYQKYLSGAQKKQLKQRAKAISLQNAADRNQLQANAMQTRRNMNQYLSNMGLSSNLQTRPSSGVDEVARRMPEFQQQLQTMRAQEQGMLNPVGAQMAQNTINEQIRKAQEAARRAAGPGGYKVMDPTTGKYVQDLQNGGDRIFTDKAEAQFLQSQLNDEARYKVTPGQITQHNTAAQRERSAQVTQLQKELAGLKQDMNGAQTQAFRLAQRSANVEGSLEPLIGMVKNIARAQDAEINAYYKQNGDQMIYTAQAGGLITNSQAEKLMQSLESGNEKAGLQVFETIAKQYENETNAAMKMLKEYDAGLTQEQKTTAGLMLTVIGDPVSAKKYIQHAYTYGEFDQGDDYNAVVNARSQLITDIAKLEREISDMKMAGDRDSAIMLKQGQLALKKNMLTQAGNSMALVYTANVQKLAEMGTIDAGNGKTQLDVRRDELFDREREVAQELLDHPYDPNVNDPRRVELEQELADIKNEIDMIAAANAKLNKEQRERDYEDLMAPLYNEPVGADVTPEKPEAPAQEEVREPEPVPKKQQNFADQVNEKALEEGKPKYARKEENGIVRYGKLVNGDYIWYSENDRQGRRVKQEYDKQEEARKESRPQGANGRGRTAATVEGKTAAAPVGKAEQEPEEERTRTVTTRPLTDEEKAEGERTRTVTKRPLTDEEKESVDSLIEKGAGIQLNAKELPNADPRAKSNMKTAAYVHGLIHGYADDNLTADERAAAEKNPYAFGRTEAYTEYDEHGQADPATRDARSKAVGLMSLMTDDEKRLLDYYAAKGPEAVGEYWGKLETYLNERATDNVMQIAAARVGDPRNPKWLGAITESLATVATSMGEALGGLYILNNTINSLVDSGAAIDPYHAIFSLQRYNESVRGNVAENIRQGAGGFTGEACAFAYQTLLSCADSFVSAVLVGGAGNALGAAAGSAAEYASLSLMGLRSASSTYNEALTNGASEGQARALGIMAGIFEGLFEKVSLESLLDTDAAKLMSVSQSMLAQAGVEASEEANTTIFNTLANFVIMGDMNDYTLAVNEYLANGYEPGAARSLAFLDQIKQVTLDAFGGFLSGGLMAGARAASMVREFKARGEEIRGYSIQNNERIQTLLEKVSDTKSKYGAKLAAQIQMAIENNGSVSNMKIGQLQHIVDTESIIEIEHRVDGLVEKGSITEEEAGIAKDLFTRQYMAVSEQTEPSAEDWAKLSDKAMKAIAGDVYSKMAQETAARDNGDKRKLTQSQRNRTIGENVNATMDSARNYDRQVEGWRNERRNERFGTGVESSIRRAGGLYSSAPYQSFASDVAAAAATAKAATGKGVSFDVNAGVKNSVMSSGKNGVEVRLHNANSLMDLSEEQMLNVKFLEAINASGNAKIIVHDTLEQTGMNGMVDAQGNIHIGLDAHGVVKATSHELFHWLEKQNGDAFKGKFDEFKTFLREQAGEGFEELVQQKMEQYGFQAEGEELRTIAESEAYAEMCERMLGDEDMIRSLVKQDKSLAQRILQHIEELFSKFKELLGADAKFADSEGAKMVQDIAKAREMFRELLGEASGNNAIASNSKEAANNSAVKVTTEIPTSSVKATEEKTASVKEPETVAEEKPAEQKPKNRRRTSVKVTPEQASLGTKNANKKTGIGSRFYVATDENMRGELETKIANPLFDFNPNEAHDVAEKVSGKHSTALEVGAKYRVTSKDGTEKELYYLGHGDFGTNLTREAIHDAEMYDAAVSMYDEFDNLKKLNKKVKDSYKKLEAISDNGSDEYKNASYDHNILVDELEKEFQRVRSLSKLETGSSRVKEDGLYIVGGFGVKRSSNKNDFGYWIVSPFFDDGTVKAGTLSTYGERVNGSYPLTTANTENKADIYDKFANGQLQYNEKTNSMEFVDDEEAKMEQGADSHLDVYEGKEPTPAQTKAKYRAEGVQVNKNGSMSLENEVRASRRFDGEYLENAIKYADKQELKTGQRFVSTDVLRAAGEARAEIAKLMEEKKIVLALPEDVTPGIDKETGKKQQGTWRSNSSYGGSQENSTVCIRSLVADEFADMVAEKLGRPLTQKETIFISQEAANYVDNPQCIYCYVAMDRAAYRGFLKTYLEERDAALETIKGGKSFAEAYEEYRRGRKDTPDMKKRFQMFYDAVQNGNELISSADAASQDAMNAAMERNPELKAQIDDINAYARSASWAKKRDDYVAYDGNILRFSKAMVKKLNKSFGMRMYSFSDYSPAFILENMQMFTDASVRGLKVLAYTKELDFVKIFAPTGASISVSCYGYMQKGMIGEDAMQGAPWEEAKALREKYPNVGITFVATNDTMVDWALKQPWVDVVIPFHLVRTGETVAKMLGFMNYTPETSDKKSANWQKGNEKEIYPTVHQNDKEAYFKALEENGLTPRFERWADHPNYMKLVNETRRAAKDTAPVKPVFNMEAAHESLKTLEKKGGYRQHVGGSVKNARMIAEETAAKIENGGVEKFTNRQQRLGMGTFGEDKAAPSETKPAPRASLRNRDNFVAASQKLADDIYYGKQLSKDEANRQQLKTQMAELRKEASKTRAERNDLQKRLGRREAAIERNAERYEKKLEMADAYRKEQLAAKDAQIAKEREKYAKMKVADRLHERETVEKIREHGAHDKYQRSIEKHVKDMYGWMTAPNKDAHVPDFMRDVVGGLVTMIDPGFDPNGANATYKNGKQKAVSKRVNNWREAIGNLRDGLLMQTLSENDSGEYAALMQTLPENFTSQLQEFISTMEGDDTLYLRDMTADQLKELNQIVATVKGAVRGVNKLYSGIHFRTVSELGDRLIESAGDKYRKTKLPEWADKFLNAEMLDAYSWGKNIGEAGEEIVDMISRGYFDKTVVKVKETKEFVEDLYKRNKISNRTVNKWSNDAQSFTLESGEHVTMSTAQLMELYCLSYRTQAMKHILGGGIEIGQSKAQTKNARPNYTYKITEGDLDTMFAKLTDQQKSIASDMQQFLSTTASEWGNEVTQRLYMYDAYGEDFYWPIKSASTAVGLKDPDKARAFNAIASAGATKAVNKYANNPLTINDAFNTFTEHTSWMASYNGISVPIADALKLMNYKQRNADGTINNNANVRKALESMVGYSAGTGYFMQLIKDMNGLSSGSTGTEMYNGLVSNFKRSAIAGKLRVVIQQPTAVIRSMAVINPKYFANTQNFRVGKTVEEMQKYSGMAYWKDQGNYEIGINKGMRSTIWGAETEMDEVTNKLMAPAGMADNLGWSWIWNAAKAEINDTTDLKRGSAEYFAAVNDLFMKAVNDTQVIDSPLHRTQVMRSKDSLVKQSTAFMAEPSKQYNMIRNALINAHRKKDKKAVGQLFGALMSVVMAQAVNALVVSGWDAARKRGDKDAEGYVKTFEKNLLDNINPLTNIIYFKDIFATLQGESIERQDLAALTDVATAVLNLKKRYMNGIEESKYTDYGVWKNFLTSLSNLAGLPFGGTWSTTEALIRIAMPDALKTRKYAITNVHDKEMLHDAVEAGMDADDFYELYHDMGAAKGVGDKATMLSEADMTTEQKVIMAGRAAEGLTKALARLPQDASDEDKELVIKWYGKHGYEGSDEDGSKNEKLRAALMREDMTADTRHMIYTTVTGSGEKIDFTSPSSMQLSVTLSEKSFERAKAAHEVGVEWSDMIALQDKRRLYSKDTDKSTNDHDVMALALDKGYTDAQIKALGEWIYGKETDRVTGAIECRKQGISGATYYKYADMRKDDDEAAQANKASVCDAMFADRTLTAKQKQALEAALYPKSKKQHDYKNADAYYISGLDVSSSSSYVEKTAKCIDAGFTEAEVATYLRKYKAAAKAKGKNPTKQETYAIMKECGISGGRANRMYKIMKASSKK